MLKFLMWINEARLGCKNEAQRTTFNVKTVTLSFPVAHFILKLTLTYLGEYKGWTHLMIIFLEIYILYKFFSILSWAVSWLFKYLLPPCCSYQIHSFLFLFILNILRHYDYLLLPRILSEFIKTKILSSKTPPECQASWPWKHLRK